MKIDAHQHFWLFNEKEYDWIGEDQQVLRRDFKPNDLLEELKREGMNKSIAVQARQSIEETDWLLQLANQHPHIAGVVGWIDLKATDIDSQVQTYLTNPLLKGFRHVLQGEADPHFMLDPQFIKGLRCLEKHHLSYDILIFAKQLPATIELAKQLPKLRLVVDHIAKPNIKTHEDFDVWAQGMRELAQCEHVYCKVSGMVTEADVNQWANDDFTRYLAVVFEAFGPERVMYGSDWPVCLLGGSYREIKNIVGDYVESHYPNYADHVFGLTAAKFYQVS